MPKTSRPPKLPHLTVGRRRMRTDASGCGLRASISQNAVSSSTAAASVPTTNGSAKPCWPAVMSPKHRLSRPSVTVTAPGTSSRGRSSARPAGTTSGATARISSATGTLSRNAQRQLNSPVSSPPISAPAVNPPESSAPLRPSARARSGPSGNTVVSRESAAGVAIAAANPCSTRAVSSVPGRSATPPSSDAAVSSTSPARKSRRRPNRSATRPKSRVKPAAGSANAVPIQARSSRAKPSPAPIAGSATLRMEKSTASMNWAPSNRKRMSRSRRSSRGGDAPAASTVVGSVTTDMGYPLPVVDCAHPGCPVRARLPSPLSLVPLGFPALSRLPLGRLPLGAPTLASPTTGRGRQRGGGRGRMAGWSSAPHSPTSCRPAAPGCARRTPGWPATASGAGYPGCAARSWPSWRA